MSKSAKPDFELTHLFNTTPEKIYSAWLSSEGHSAMTGGDAEVSAKKGEAFTAWDGYISGSNTELEKNKRILQAWRTSEFGKDDPDSWIEILLAKKGKQTELILRHGNIPAGQADSYKQGWMEHYFIPMEQYFAS